MSRIQECQRNEKLLQTVQVIRGYNIVDPLAKCSGYNTIPGEIIGSEMPVQVSSRLCRPFLPNVKDARPSLEQPSLDGLSQFWWCCGSGAREGVGCEGLCHAQSCKYHIRGGGEYMYHLELIPGVSHGFCPLLSGGSEESRGKHPPSSALPLVGGQNYVDGPTVVIQRT